MAGPRQVLVTKDGPLLVEGPLVVRTEDGRTVTADRPIVALCMCGRSGIYPLCDTSHRARCVRDQKGEGP